MIELKAPKLKVLGTVGGCFKCQTDLGQVSQGVTESRPSLGQCGHSWIYVTQSTAEPPPYWFCAKCGAVSRNEPSAPPSLTGLIEQWQERAKKFLYDPRYDEDSCRQIAACIDDCADELAALLAGKEK